MCKYPQTTPWHREKKPLNHHETPGSQIKQSNQLSLPHQDDCNTRMDIKLRKTKHRTDSNLSHRRGGGLNAFYWYQIFALDAVVEVQEMFSSHGNLLTNAVYHHGETLSSN